MSLPTLVMMIGLPGSGKSHLAKSYKAMGYNVHSSDEIREELSGDVNRQDINTDVFNLLHKRIKEDLSNGISCVYDATNMSYKRRMGFLDQIKGIRCWKKAMFVATPYEVCLERNDDRERKVPEFVIERMYRKFDPPYYYEGWNEIEVYYGDTAFKSAYKTPGTFIEHTMDYDQQNKYHSETLGAHCLQCMEYVVDHYDEDYVSQSFLTTLYSAACLHDCGKPFCQTFKDAKGKDCDSAHYYDHEHIGGYNIFFYDMPMVDKLYASVLVRWHMQMHFIDKQPHTQEKYKNLFGYALWRDLTYLHKGDLKAHSSTMQYEC